MASKSEKDRAKQIQDRCQNILLQMLKDEDNKYCVDCDAKGMILILLFYCCFHFFLEPRKQFNIEIRSTTTNYRNFVLLSVVVDLTIKLQIFLNESCIGPLDRIIRNIIYI